MIPEKYNSIYPDLWSANPPAASAPQADPAPSAPPGDIAKDLPYGNGYAPNYTYYPQYAPPHAQQGIQAPFPLPPNGVQGQYVYPVPAPHQQHYAAPLSYEAMQQVDKDIVQFKKEYTAIQKDLDLINQLPSLNLDARSIQSLNEMERKSQGGLISGLLTITAKVIEIFGKVLLGLALGTPLTLGIFRLCGFSARQFQLSAARLTPFIIIWGLQGLACKVAVYVIRRFNQCWKNISFRVLTGAKKQEIENLKKWGHVKNLLQKENSFKNASQKFLEAEQYFSIPDRLKCVDDLDRLTKKITVYRGVEFLMSKDLHEHLSR